MLIVYIRGYNSIHAYQGLPRHALYSFPPVVDGKDAARSYCSFTFSTSIVQFPLLLYTSCVSESLNVVTVVALLAYSNVSVFGVHTENGAYSLRTVSKSIICNFKQLRFPIGAVWTLAPFSYENRVV